MSTLSEVNLAIEQASPALWSALSPLGREAVYPPDIPFQAAEARGKRYNATIGQITDGSGRILALEAIERWLGALPGDERNRALLYSPIEGIAELRQRWREHERPAGAPPSSLPLVTVGLTHGLALVADLFGGAGRSVFVPAPFWGNYRTIFGLRTGARLVPVEAFPEHRFRPTALADALASLPAGEPAVVILNLPSNPTGYSPSRAERTELRGSLLGAAALRPLVVVCDDAYAGLVYEPEIPADSLFWELLDAHPNLIPVRLAGSTKELVFFGGRVGFLTLPFAPEAPVTRALESKLKCLLRAGVGSPVALSQVVALAALCAPGIEQQIRATRERLGERYRALRAALERADPELLRVLPCNSGAFALVELPAEIDPEVLRRHLLAREDTGVVAIPPRYVRIAFCSVAAADLPEVVLRLERGVRALLG